MGAREGHGDPPTVATEAMTHDAHYALSIESLKTDKNNRGYIGLTGDSIENASWCVMCVIGAFAITPVLAINAQNGHPPLLRR
jgi:hypothetical protein